MHIFRTLSRTLVAAVSSAVMFVPGPASALTITVNNSSGSCSSSVDGAGNVTINCSGGGGGTPSCTVTPSSQTMGSSGGAINALTASNCGTGTWSSTRPGFAGCSGVTCSDTLPANTTANTVSYTYTFAGSSGTQSATVFESGSGSSGGGGGTPGTISCSNIPGITATKVIALSWQYQAGVHIAKQTSFGPNDAIVFQFTPPAGYNSGGKRPWIGFSPSDGFAYNSRVAALSDTPCDVSGKLGLSSLVGGQNDTLFFSVGGYPLNAFGAPDTSYPNLDPGRTYYITVVQRSLKNSVVSSSSTCNYSQCNVDYTFSLQ